MVWHFILLIAAAFVLAHSICALNGMGLSSDHLGRISHVLMAVGAFAIIASNLLRDGSLRFGYAVMAVGFVVHLFAPHLRAGRQFRHVDHHQGVFR